MSEHTDKQHATWAQHPIRTLHGCVETLANAFKGYLPWPEDKRDANVRRLEALAADTLARADACMVILDHAEKLRTGDSESTSLRALYDTLARKVTAGSWQNETYNQGLWDMMQAAVKLTSSEKPQGDPKNATEAAPSATAEPVAWRFKPSDRATRWAYTDHKPIFVGEGEVIQPLYVASHTAPEEKERVCPYCTSDNEAIRSTYYDQTCEGCVKRMGQ